MSRFDKLEIPDRNQESGMKKDDSGQKIIYDAGQFMELADRGFWQGNYDNALRYYAKALAENPGLEKAWLGQVLCLVRLNEIKEALIWVDNALSKFPRDSDILAARALVSGRLNQKAQAMDFSDAAISENTNSFFPWIVRGDVLLQVKSANADRCFQKATEIQRNDWRVMTFIGDSCFENACYRKALIYYQKAVEIDPENARTWLQLGRCRRNLGFSGADDAFDHCRELRPNWKQAEAIIHESIPFRRKLKRIIGKFKKN